MKTISLLFLLLLATTLHAGITGKIAGRVVDAETGEALIGTNISLEGTKRGTMTDENGQFYLLNLPPGKYTLRFSMIGYEKQILNEVRVSSDYTTSLKVELKSTVIEGKTVTVTAKRPLIQKDLTSTAAAISEARIAALPAERMEEFIRLQAGVTVDTKGQIHIRGGRATEIAYLIDGMPVTDGFDRTQAIEVENSGIQELQVISGTFNAEYGQAQSGIINIITKKGSNRFTGEAAYYTGDFLTPHTGLFYHLDDADYLTEQNFDAKISGPIPKTGATFFLSARAALSDGWLYGQREWMMPEIQEKVEGYTIYNSNAQPGDSAYLSMNDFQRYALQGNISLNRFENFPLSYSFFYNQGDEAEYDHRFSRLPEGNSRFYKTSSNHIVNLKYILSATTFFSLDYSRLKKQTRRYLYDDPLDVRWLFPALSSEQIYRTNSLEGLEYVLNASNNEHYKIQNQTDIFKLDFTSQVHAYHLLKAGAEWKRYHIDYKFFEVINRSDNKVEKLFLPMVDDVSTTRHDNYSNEPVEAALFLQDKIEFHEIIVNAGLRWDYFDSRGFFPSTPDEKDGGRLSAPKKAASVKQQLSPRFGLAFPISDQGVIHFSYGHFTQIPDFRSLYWNSEYEIRLGALSTEVGNPDLKPEQTVSWELGIQHQIAADMALVGTIYFKDIKNLLGQEIIRLKGGQAYAHYINRDYGNVRGFTIAFEKRPTQFLAVDVDYTFQKAKGNASDPFAVYTDNQGTPPRESEKQVLPLDWDQRHTINASLTLSDPQKWGLSCILQWGSGLPYTPTDPDRSLRIAFENSERKPPTFNVDMLAHYDFQFFGFSQSFFLKAYNLFDIENEIDVFTDTGRATYTHALNYGLGDRRPDFFSRPRLVLAGVRIGYR
jgi:outer membrane receptor protein involved in Fe transport